MGNYTTQQVADIVGIPYRTLNSWITVGLLNPENKGYGKRPSFWDKAGLSKAYVLAAAKNARERIEELLKDGPDDVTGKYLVIHKSLEGRPDTARICELTEVLSMLEKGRADVVLPLWKV